MKHDSHEIHKQHAFDSFCKKLLKNETRNYYSDLKRKGNKEISFDDLSERDMVHLQIEDEYPSDCYSFKVLSHDIVIQDESIADAITILPREKRDIILLAYFLGMSDEKIAEKLNMVRRTVQYKRASSINELRKILEEK